MEEARSFVRGDDWAEALVHYQADQLRRGLSPRSSKRLSLRVVSLSRFHPEPWTVTPEVITAWLDAAGTSSAGSLSSNSRRCYVSAVSNFYEWAIRTGRTDYNPAFDVHRDWLVDRSSRRDMLHVEAAAWIEPLRLYKRHQRRRGIAPTSITTRARILRQLSSVYPDPWRVEADDLEEWLDDPAKSLPTRRCYLSCVSGFYRWAVNVDLTDRDPTAKVQRPRVKRGLPRPISAESLADAVAIADPLTKSWLLLAARQGLRCQEIAGLDREDVLDHQDPALLLVRHAKGGRERLIPLHPEVLAQLRRTLTLRRQGPLFPNRYGQHRSAAGVSKAINTYLHSIGIEATAHQLRHRFATDVYSASRDLRMTQELLGHQSPDTTAIYAAWAPGEAVDIVRGLGGAKPAVVSVDDLRKRAAELEEMIGRDDVIVSAVDFDYFARHEAAARELVELANGDVELLTQARHEPIEVGHIFGQGLLVTALRLARRDGG